MVPAHAGTTFHYTGVTIQVLAVNKTTLLTKEWTPLQPGVIDHKLYRRGVGTVLEQTVKGGGERNTLISVTHS